MNAFFSCLIFISVLNPLLSNGLNLSAKDVKNYMRTSNVEFSANDGDYRCSHCDVFDADGCDVSAGAQVNTRRTCDLQYKPQADGIFCESTCIGTKNPSSVRYICKSLVSGTGTKGCTGCMKID
ncbi:hypothetical protein PGT21_029288 [Puccinia graminis f. sp. tritici]|uniref:Uncharacterized protein n=1 Tax=Puccinia graminis f. sp. tritici TaxID=56615 RepID=A0A5B0P3R4_PUCGR|nr:hypothetical protein PGT21_029288 [Puccinia graminis f. sp. tritici]KAA1121549.1 hypothetical protein PGTUg99_031879 [Puccinia graminis f. sp. tritici]